MIKRYLVPSFCLTLFAATRCYCAVVLVDDFQVAQSAETSAAAISSDANSVADVSVLGGNRDLAVEKTAGTVAERIRAQVNPSGQDLLRHVLDAANGRTVVTWDGSGGGDLGPGPSQVDFDGLPPVDFASQSSQVDVLLNFSDIGGPIRFTFWDADDPTGATFATATISAPGGVAPGSSVPLSVSFGSFAATGASLEDIFSSVGAVQLEVDATAIAQEGWDMRLDYVQTSGSPFSTLPSNSAVPEPSTSLLLTVGIIGLPARRRRRGPPLRIRKSGDPIALSGCCNECFDQSPTKTKFMRNAASFL
jgi:hypothetical protein